MVNTHKQHGLRVPVESVSSPFSSTSFSYNPQGVNTVEGGPRQSLSAPSAPASHWTSPSRAPPIGSSTINSSRSTASGHSVSVSSPRRGTCATPRGSSNFTPRSAAAGRSRSASPKRDGSPVPFGGHCTVVTAVEVLPPSDFDDVRRRCVHSRGRQLLLQEQRMFIW